MAKDSLNKRIVNELFKHKKVGSRLLIPLEERVGALFEVDKSGDVVYIGLLEKTDKKREGYFRIRYEPISITYIKSDGKEIREACDFAGVVLPYELANEIYHILKLSPKRKEEKEEFKTYLKRFNIIYRKEK